MSTGYYTQVCTYEKGSHFLAQSTQNKFDYTLICAYRVQKMETTFWRYLFNSMLLLSTFEMLSPLSELDLCGLFKNWMTTWLKLLFSLLKVRTKPTFLGVRAFQSCQGVWPYMGDFTRSGEWLLKNVPIFFFGKIQTSINISIDGLQQTCMYQLGSAEVLIILF